MGQLLFIFFRRVGMSPFSHVRASIWLIFLLKLLFYNSSDLWHKDTKVIFLLEFSSLQLFFPVVPLIPQIWSNSWPHVFCSGIDKSGPELIRLVESSNVGVIKETLCVPDNVEEIRYHTLVLYISYIYFLDLHAIISFLNLLELFISLFIS